MTARIRKYTSIKFSQRLAEVRAEVGSGGVGVSPLGWCNSGSLDW